MSARRSAETSLGIATPARGRICTQTFHGHALFGTLPLQ